MRYNKINLVIVMALIAVLAGSIFDFGYAMDKNTALTRLNDESSQVRRQAAYYLGKTGDQTCVEPLIERLSDRDAHVRRIAAHALGKLNDSRAVTALVELVKDQSQPTCVRCSAAYALGRIGDRRAEKTLAQTAQEEQGWLQRVAVGSLTKLKPVTSVAMSN